MCKPSQQNEAVKMHKLLKFEQVHERTQRSRSRLYADMLAGDFPRPVKLGARAVAWPESEVEAWIAARMAERGA